MKKPFLLFFFFCLCLACKAQMSSFNPRESCTDIAFSSGIYGINEAGNLSPVLDQGTVYAVDYGCFQSNGWGLRGGFTFVDGLGNDLNLLQLPLYIGWRTPYRGRRKLYEVATDVMYSATLNRDLKSGLWGLIPIRAELYAGLTPGLVQGHDSSYSGWSSWEGDYTDGIQIKNRFMLSADLSFRVSLRIWRFNLFIHPGYHYWLTKNFLRTGTYNYKQIGRSYVSVRFGGSFLF